jgi:hypothetical protein
MGSEEPSSSQPGEAGARVEGDWERFGPIRLRRFTKDDGRALILFERLDEPRGDDSVDTGAGGE